MEHLRLPVFVYGTLRPGHVNYQRLLAGRAIRETPAQAAGLALYGHGLPYAVPTAGAVTIGALIHIDPAGYDQTLADLDRLEGFRPGRPDRSHYIRARWAITAGGDTVTAWIYLAGPRIDPADLDPIPGNDWELAHT